VSRVEHDDGTARNSQFEPLVRTSFAADAIRTIKHMILDGRLEPGQRLPPERALSEALGVSRPTVREAIRSLQAMNILESRHGAGTFVSSLSVDELLRPLQFVLALSDSALEHLFEVRLLLEPGAAALAAERATDERLQLMRDCVARSYGPELTVDDHLRLDVELHELVVHASDNALLEHLMASISAMGEESRNYTARLPGVQRLTRREHEAIVDAICARSPERARAAMTAHISRIRDAALARPAMARPH
jgi:GntR family transcriptional regulator, transcriptional repressor for pyruvate dehydrogenase complex